MAKLTSNIFASAPQSILSGSPATPAIQEVDEKELREFGDVSKTRQSIYDNVYDTLNTLEPVSNATHTLQLKNLQWQDPDRFTKRQRKEAQLTGRTLARRLRGTWELLDNASGSVIERRQQTILKVPHLTDSGTFVHNGNEYAIKNQSRLRPGIYSRHKDNGEIESHANVQSGGPSHRYFLDPAKGVFYLRAGQAKIPLMPLLSALGATEPELRKAWGQEIYASNYSKKDGGALQKLKTKLLSEKLLEEHGGNVQQALRAKFEGMLIDPEISQSTLGKNYDKLDKDAILAATSKLLAISRGEAETDDRDQLAYQTFHGPEDLLAERLKKDRAGVRRQLLFKMTNKNSLKSMPSSALQKQLESAFLESGLGLNLEEINPSEILDKQSQITRLGEGGIPCHSADTEVLTAAGWKAWPETTEQDDFACNIEGELQYRKPTRLFSADYDGELLEADNRFISYSVTPDHRLYVSRPTTKAGKHAVTDFEFYTAKQVHGKRVKHQIGGPVWLGGQSPEYFTLEIPPTEKSNHGSAATEELKIQFRLWLSFLAMYLADGYYSYNLSRKEFRTFISKRKTVNPIEASFVENVLDRMGVTYRYEKDSQYVISGKQLACYVRQFGKSRDKFIPDYVLQANKVDRELFLNTITTFDCSGRSEFSRLYASASKPLRDSVAVMAIQLGYSVKYFERQKGKEAVQYQVKIREATRASISQQGENCQYASRRYTGKVFCAEVPGGLLLTRYKHRVIWSGNSTQAIPAEARDVQSSHLGFMDPIRTPESSRAGVDTYLSHNSRKGRDGKLYTQFTSMKTGQPVWRTPQQAKSLVLGFPGASRSPGKRVAAMKDGKMTYVNKQDVDLELPYMENAFSPLGNLVPLKSMVKGQRVAMASRMFTQALPVINPEAPLVQSAMPGTNESRSFEEEYGKYMGAIRAKQPGRVTAIDGENVHVQYQDGSRDVIEMYQTHPYNRKTAITQTPTVQPGQPFQEGDLLARSNFTDERGATALGLNARVAYIPWKGKNFEDAIVISEGMAKRMTSDHLYQHSADMTPRTQIGKNSFIQQFASKYDKKTLDNFDANGAIKPGTVVNYGDPLVLAVEQQSRAQNKVHKQGQAAYVDRSVTWEHHDPGTVTDVVESKQGPVVLVKSQQEMKIGDKLTGRYGGKGILADIIPDAKMPHDIHGKPFEVLLNPLGIVSRANPAQIAEAALGKLARKLGRPIRVEDFNDVEDRAQWAADILKRHGMSLTEDLIDPETGNKIPNINTGERFFMKLMQQAEDKGQGRGGGGYSQDDSPAKGGVGGSKRMSLLDQNALLSHNAHAVMKDANLIRGQKNEQYWLQFMQGHNPRPPQVPLVYRKFVAELQGAGINVVRDGPRTQIMAMTNQDVKALAGDRFIQNGETVRFDKDLKPIPGGLFDPRLTSGHNSQKWSAIKLPVPLPNPVMEDPIRHMLNLTKQQFRDVLSGEESLAMYGTGPQAIAKALDKMNVDSQIVVARAQIKGTNKGLRDKAVRKLGYLKAAKRLDIHPRDWLLDAVPVLPTKFRPISKMGEKELPLVSDANYLYKELLDATKNYDDLKGMVGDQALGNENLAVYDAFKAVTGLGDPITEKSREKNVTGLLKGIFGSAPKFSTVQHKLLSSKVDNVGRAVISPNPDFDMDTIGLPEDKAFDVYARFIVRRLRRKGMTIAKAMQEVKDKSKLARQMMLEEMETRPVISNRAPVLHRFGIMAFKPKLVKGSTLQMSPLVVKGFNADFDGDMMNYHVPADEDARKEALEKMLPSRQLISPADFKSVVHAPANEYVGGLAEFSGISGYSSRAVRTFRSKADVIKAYRQGLIGGKDRVKILES